MDRKLGYQRLSKLLFRIDHSWASVMILVWVGEILSSFTFNRNWFCCGIVNQTQESKWNEAEWDFVICQKCSCRPSHSSKCRYDWKTDRATAANSSWCANYWADYTSTDFCRTCLQSSYSVNVHGNYNCWH